MSGWTILILVLVLSPVLLLTMPIAFRAGGVISPGGLGVEARVAWGWGLFAATVMKKGNETSIRLGLAGIPLSLPRRKPGKAGGGDLKKKAGDGKIKKKAGRDGKTGRFGLSTVGAVLNRKLLNAVLEYVKRLLGSLRVRLRLSGVFGADDPALTGAILALMAALHAENINLDLNADFSGPVLDVNGEISGRVVPIVILWLTIRLFLAEPARKIWWALLKSKLAKTKTKEVAQHV